MRLIKLKRMNKVKSGNRADSINSLLYLAIRHIPKECQVTENNGACRSLFVPFIDGRYLAWFIRFKNKIRRINAIYLA